MNERTGDKYGEESLRKGMPQLKEHGLQDCPQQPETRHRHQQECSQFRGERLGREEEQETANPRLNSPAATSNADVALSFMLIPRRVH
jgi:hypothetical protein